MNGKTDIKTVRDIASSLSLSLLSSSTSLLAGSGTVCRSYT